MLIITHLRARGLRKSDLKVFGASASVATVIGIPAFPYLVPVLTLIFRADHGSTGDGLVIHAGAGVAAILCIPGRADLVISFAHFWSACHLGAGDALGFSNTSIAAIRGLPLVTQCVAITNRDRVGVEIAAIRTDHQDER